MSGRLIPDIRSGAILEAIQKYMSASLAQKMDDAIIANNLSADIRALLTISGVTVIWNGSNGWLLRYRKKLTVAEMSIGHDYDYDAWRIAIGTMIDQYLEHERHASTG
jgi:hypothetical protein